MITNSSIKEKPLYIIGGISALVVVVLWIIQVIAVSLMGTPPGTVIEWFAMFKTYGSLGLLNSFLLDSIAFIVMVPVFLSLYFLLRSTSPVASLIAIVLKLIGIVLGIVTSVSLSMYSLSSQYAASAIDVQKSEIIASAQAILTQNQDGTASAFTLILGSIAGLIISFAMLRGTIFGKGTAIIGILANTCQLIEPPTAFVPIGFYKGMGIGVLIIFLSFALFVIWYIQIAWSLFRLSRVERNEVSK